MTLPQASDYMFLMASLYRRGEHEDAIRLMRDHPISTSTFYWSLLAAVAGRLGGSEGAAAAFQSLDQLQPGFSSILEADLRNRLFRDDFVMQLTADFDRATATPRYAND